jgi:hypothetical protein
MRQLILIRGLAYASAIVASTAASAVVLPYVGGYSWTLGTLRARRMWSKRVEAEERAA